MKILKNCKIGIGTAQWGMHYGISNKSGKTREDEIIEILSFAKDSNIRIIDTAPNYGNAEKIIGDYSDSHFKIITKIPHLQNQKLTISDKDLILKNFEISLKNLRKEKIYCLLIHNFNDLLKDGSENIIECLYELKASNLVEKIGISIYANCDINQLLEKFTIDLIQIPINIFDQRLLQNGSLSTLKSKGIEIHARSIFLQGLILMDNFPKYFSRWSKKLNDWNIFCEKNSKSKLEIALNFVNNLPEIDSLILGFENIKQLKEIYNSLDIVQNIDLTEFASNDDKFLNPINWRKDEI